jgi:threonine dehydratase
VLGVQGRIFMPTTTPRQKVSQVAFFGGPRVEIVLIGDTFDDAYAEAIAVSQRDEMAFIHPFDDPGIIAGNGTIGLEILEAASETPDYLFMTVGGGGLECICRHEAPSRDPVRQRPVRRRGHGRSTARFEGAGVYG